MPQDAAGFDAGLPISANWDRICNWSFSRRAPLCCHRDRSNESFSGWTKTFTDPRLRAAIVDRLTFNGTIIETGTDSYRLGSCP